MKSSISEIDTQEPSKKEIGYMNWANVQASLPYRKPLYSAKECAENRTLIGIEKDIWVRRNGKYKFIIQSGKDEDDISGKMKNIGLPYGTYPRLILAYLTREAVVKGERRIYLGDNFNQFMKNIGIKGKSGGLNGNQTRLKEQLVRLLTSNMTIKLSGEDNMEYENISLASSFNFWFDNKVNLNLNWKREILLNHDYYDAITTAAVPLDLRILFHEKIVRSAMAIDVYMWLTYRMQTVRRSSRIRWTTLEKQFGSNFARTLDFKARFKVEIKKVQSVWSGFKCVICKDGVILSPSGKPSVPRLY